MRENTERIIRELSLEFPNPKSELNFSSVYELLIAVILSAQCTDKRVNKVTQELFQIANTPEEMLELGRVRLEEIIHSCGFFRAKAEHILMASQQILSEHNGQVPNNIPQLMKLSGVGRKTANVVYAVGFNGDAIAVDTHVFRVSNRLGIVNAKTPEQTEMQLREEIDKSLWSDAHHYILLHGRYVCKSQRPNCFECKLSEMCKYYNQKNSI